MDNESDKYIYIFSILLTISELLPYIKSIKSNGILELIFQACFLLLKKYKGEEISQELLENLLHENNTNNENNNDNCNVKKECLTITSENITITFNSPKEIKISQPIKQT